MSPAPRLFRTWTQAVTELGLEEEIDAFALSNLLKAKSDENLEAYRRSARSAEEACASAGVQRDANGFLSAPNPLMLPPNLPADLNRAYRALIDRDILLARQRRTSAEFSDRCECAGAALLEAAKRGKIEVKAKPDETARISVVIEPCEFEFLDWHMSIGDDRLQNHEQAFYWRQVTVDERQFQALNESPLPAYEVTLPVQSAPSRRSKVAGDRLRLSKILLDLYPEGDPVSVGGLGTDVILDACKERMGKRSSAPTLYRARRAAYSDLI